MIASDLYLEPGCFSKIKKKRTLRTKTGYDMVLSADFLNTPFNIHQMTRIWFDDQWQWIIQDRNTYEPSNHQPHELKNSVGGVEPNGAKK